ncbi:MAG: protein kinase [Chloroflexi bacterium]|nr:protein kinase [Chloroflexota bacterium]
MNSSRPAWVGKTLGNRYKIEAILGRGGMSVVYRAHDPNLNRKVALKIIHPHLTNNADFIRRFEQEATLIAQLRHPHIIQVHDFSHDENTYYMVMEHIPGETLSHRLQTLNDAGMRLPLADSVRIMSKICDAVDYAHQRRMIHRDLKPANIMLTLLGEPILMDFGIARLVGDQPQTAVRGPFGTAAYMSPEQVHGEEADHRSDIYALGIMLYEMLSGDLPFFDESTYQLMVKQVNEPVPDIQAVEMNTPHSLVNIMEKALSKNPDNRFQTAAEMGNALNTLGIQMDSPADTLADRHLGRLETLWQEAHNLFDDRQWIACLDKLDELRRTDADYKHNKTTIMREDTLNHLSQQARRLYDAEKYAESLACIQAIRSRDAEFPVNELEFKVLLAQQQAGLRAQLEELYTAATDHLEKREYTAALVTWESVQLQKEDLTFPDRLLVEKRAKEGICTAVYTEAISALAQQDPELALAKMAEVSTYDPRFPDPQQVKSKAEAMLNQLPEPARTRPSWVWPLLIILLLLIIVGIIFIPPRLNQVTVATSPTPTVELAVVLPTNPPTKTATATATPTAQPTTTPTLLPTATATATPTATPSQTPTAMATTQPSEKATVRENVTVFAEPVATAAEITILEAGEEVWVLGRSQTGNWLYVSTDAGNRGFVSLDRLDWSGDVASLLIREGTPLIANSTNIPNPDGSVVTLALYQLEGTQQCNGQAWTMSVFMEGLGGNDRYNYYWNDQLLAAEVNGSHTFTVSSDGGPVIGTGRVTSGSNTAEAELFINNPHCNE